MNQEIIQIIELVFLCFGFSFLIFYSLKWLLVFYKNGVKNWNYEEFHKEHKKYRTIGILVILIGIIFSLFT